MDLWTLYDKHCVSALCHPLSFIWGWGQDIWVEDLATSSGEPADAWDVTVFIWLPGLFQVQRFIVASIFRNEFCNLKSWTALKTQQGSKVDLRKSCWFPACSPLMSLLFQHFFLLLILHPCFFNLCWHFQSSDFRQTAQTPELHRLASELICFQLDTKREQKQLINQSLFTLCHAETTNGTDDFSRAAALAFCRII